MSAYPAPSNWSVYGLRLVGSTEYRYVGLTRGNLRERLLQHRNPKHNSRVPVSKWAAKEPDEVVLDVLESVQVGDDQALFDSEQYWISQLRWFGHRLLNLSDGGDSGSYGARWTLKPDQVRGRERHPFYGRTHTDSAKEANRQKHLGKKMPDTWKGYAGHVRWHVSRDISKPESCRFCIPALD